MYALITLRVRYSFLAIYAYFWSCIRKDIPKTCHTHFSYKNYTHSKNLTVVRVTDWNCACITCLVYMCWWQFVNQITLNTSQPPLTPPSSKQHRVALTIRPTYVWTLRCWKDQGISWSMKHPSYEDRSKMNTLVIGSTDLFMDMRVDVHTLTHMGTFYV